MILGSPRRADALLPTGVLLACFVLAVVQASGCVVPRQPPPPAPVPLTPAKKFSEVLSRYPQTLDEIQAERLSNHTIDRIAPSLRGKPVTAIVHPGYSLFFREESRSTYSEAKYDLLKAQLDAEEWFISEIAKTDNVVILVLPGNYQKDSIAPRSYTYYLNAMTGRSPTVFYVYTETSSSGVLTKEAAVTLYGFLNALKSETLLVGGGFVGRCQREFYAQIATYFDSVTPYVIPEISSVSPDDISDDDALLILDGLRKRDYSPVNELIQKKTKGQARIMKLPHDQFL